MATENLQIPDISASQNQKEVTANAAHNLLDRAINNKEDLTVGAGSQSLTAIQMRENWLINCIGTPGAPWQLDMFDTNVRVLAVLNNSDDQGTIRNSAAGGTGQPVIEVGEAAIFHYDGTNFIDITDAFIAATTWISLADTPASYATFSGRLIRVNDAEDAVEFVQQAAANNVIAATTGDGVFASAFDDASVIDGVTLVTGDRILIKNQTAGEENGVYIVQASGAPVRVPEFDDQADVQENPFIVAVLEGTANAGTVYVHTTAGAITVDTTPLTFVQFGSVATFTGLSDTPGSFTGEAGTRLAVNTGETALVFEGTWWKDAVAIATTANITLSGEQTIDGVLTATDRVLVKNQSTGAENGIYVSAAGSWTRADDLDDDKDAQLGLTVAVNEGTANAQTIWQMTNTAAVTVGSTTMVFAQAGGSASNRWVEAVLQTTDATEESIVDIPLASGEAKVVRGFIIGTEGSTANSFAANFFASAKNNGGTSAELASPTITKHDASPAGAWDFLIDVDDTGDDLRLRVIGEAATTIDWRVQYEVITEDNT